MDAIFDPEFVNELDSVISLQESVMSITYDNIDQIYNTILSIYQKSIQDQSPLKIHNDQAEFIKFISSTLLSVAHYRPTMLTPLSQLAGKLFESFDGLKESLLHLPLKVQSTQWHIAFLYECFVIGCINEDDVFEILHYYKYHYSSMHGAIYLIFQYFHQVIRKKDPQFYEDSFNYLIKNKRRYDINVSSDFFKIRKNKINDLNEIKEDEFEYDKDEEEKFNDTVRYWFPKGSIERIIRDDDFVAFKEMTTNNPEFKMNEIFSIKSIFCYSELLKNHINFLSLAAFFGSSKIFTYLLEIGVNKNPLFDGNISPIIRYAISGGNVEIIKQCELDIDNETEIKHSIDASIEYFRFSLFQWIYDNKLENFQQFTQIQVINNQHLMVHPTISFLITAAKVNNMKMLLFLLDNVDGSCDINQCDYYGWTPLHFAAKYRNIEAIKVILNCKLLNLEPKSVRFFFFIHFFNEFSKFCF